MINIYTDGSCLKPQGPGGYAFVIIEEDGTEYYFCEGEDNTTNNRMEIKAIIEALKCIKENQSCIIYSDSKLAINCASGLWKRNKNLDLWEEYDVVCRNKKVTFKWVKGHSNNYYNEKVDKLALKEAKSIIIV